MTKIQTSFRSYQPPQWLERTVLKLLSVVPAEQVHLIETIVLTDADGIGKGKTQRVRGRKHARRNCRGFYHPAGPHSAAWIEIVVDNVFANVPHFALAVPVIRELLLASTAYHEIGHHLQRIYGEQLGEAPAENWSRRLSLAFLRRHYWWLLALFWPVDVICRLTRGRAKLA